MDPSFVASLVGIGVSTASALMQMYTTFRRTNVEQYFTGLMETGQDLTSIGEREELQRFLFSIVDKVAHEANVAKINSWKNATVHLATDFKDFNYKDNFLSTLENLTVFDLTVLHKIYSTDFSKEHFEKDLIEFFVSREVPKDLISQSIKRLASHNLVNEQVDRTAVLGGSNGPILGSMYYKKNELGPAFVRFISDSFVSENIK